MANSEAPEPVTLAELGVSRERVRQLQREAEGVLRDAAGELKEGRKCSSVAIRQI